MKNLQEFIKNPIAYIAILLIGCVGYLFVDNKALHGKIEVIYQKNIEQGEQLRNRMITAIERNNYILSKLEEKLTFIEKNK